MFHVLSRNSLTDLSHYTPVKVHHQARMNFRKVYLRSIQAAIPLLCTLLNMKPLFLLILHEADRTNRQSDRDAAMLILKVRGITQGCQIHAKK